MTTTYLDDFDRVGLGTVAANGTAYTNTGTSWAIVANQVVNAGTAGVQFLTADFAETDPIVSTVFGDNLAGDHGIALRVTDTSNFVWVVYESGTILVQVRTGGGNTILDSWSVGASPSGKTLSVHASGNQYAVTFDGSLLGTATDTGNNFLFVTAHGLVSFSTTAVFDDLSVTTRLTPPAIDPLPVTWTGQTFYPKPMMGPLPLAWTGRHFVLPRPIQPFPSGRRSLVGSPAITATWNDGSSIHRNALTLDASTGYTILVRVIDIDGSQQLPGAVSPDSMTVVFLPGSTTIIPGLFDGPSGQVEFDIDAGTFTPGVYTGRLVGVYALDILSYPTFPLVLTITE